MGQARRGKYETMFSGHGDGDCAAASDRTQNEGAYQDFSARCQTARDSCRVTKILIWKPNQPLPSSLRSISGCSTSKRRLVPGEVKPVGSCNLCPLPERRYYDESVRRDQVSHDGVVLPISWLVRGRALCLRSLQCFRNQAPRQHGHSHQVRL